jgi:DNA-directed RNA polymerase specialized sigma24 family protein
MTYKGCEYETILELHTLIMANETLLGALEKELQRKRMIRDVDLASTETRTNLQRNFVKELKRLEEDLVDKIDKIAFSLSDLEAQIFLRNFVIGMSPNCIMKELSISSSSYYRNLSLINEKLKDNDDFKSLTEALKTE